MNSEMAVSSNVKPRSPEGRFCLWLHTGFIFRLSVTHGDLELLRCATSWRGNNVDNKDTTIAGAIFTRYRNGARTVAIHSGQRQCEYEAVSVSFLYQGEYSRAGRTRESKRRVSCREALITLTQVNRVRANGHYTLRDDG